MKNRLHLALACFGLLVASHSLHAQAGSVVVTNDPVSIISITNTTLTVPDPTAGAIKGGGTGIASTAGAVLRITTNQSNRKITAVRNALPTGAVFTVALGTHTSPHTGGGTATTITTTATDFVTGISNLASDEHDAAGIPLIYNLTLAENTPSGGFTATVTYTIEAGS
ncbi:MAG: hypothetical protein QM760_08235 [Nibricoccus sp.]